MLLPDLQALTFERLRYNLNATELERLLSAPEVAAISSLVTLVQYVYGNIARPQNGEEPMQRLVFSFIALNYSCVGAEEDVRQLVAGGGDLAIDL